MRGFLLAVCALALAGCTDSIEDSLQTARSDLERDQQQLDGLRATCAYGPERSPDDLREEALAEWDAAAGENLDNISPEQEWEIRKSLGARMGLAPSEVNGWKDIYRGRAEQAKRVLKAREDTRKLDNEMRATQQKAACEGVGSSSKVVEYDRTEVARLERELKEQADAPGFITYVGYGFLGVLVLGIAGWLVIGIIDRRAQRGLAITLQQVRLDGLMRQAQIFIDELPADRRQAIADAHGRRDLNALTTLVRESAPNHLREHIL
jgi:hypothetical protein